MEGVGEKIMMQRCIDRELATRRWAWAWAWGLGGVWRLFVLSVSQMESLGKTNDVENVLASPSGVGVANGSCQ